MMPAVGTRKEPPRLCAKYWEECAQKQALLSSFFKKKSTCASDPCQPRTQLLCGPDTPDQRQSTEPITCPRSTPTPPVASRPGKRKNTRTDAPTAPTKKKIKTDTTGQAKLSSFFSHPKHPASGAPRALDLGGKPSPKDGAIAIDDADSPGEEGDEAFQKDLLLAISLSQGECAPSSIEPPKGKEKGKAAWSHLLAPIEAPLCDVHKEPTREYTVNKPGPNKGKRFFLCSRFGGRSARDTCAKQISLGRLVPDMTWVKNGREVT